MIKVIVTPKLITVCNSCKIGLEYELDDVRKKTESVYNGFFTAADYIVKKFIECPRCGAEVKLSLG